ncbi:response regulator [Mucilaginibacter sp. KACC 22063]|uniref:response regulator n=1 Tax=Mucilaginibacter sp. KACC 22063 TaxID=3025666 RepID=UPI00236620D5|nr:response regulator [Mucilaginibacter sp. KACC 22063]WDF54943.1 response regulator [Mucilaginibacter sp. KACC 22063]
MSINPRTVSILLVDDDEINNFISIKLIKKALISSDIKACLNGKFAIDELLKMKEAGPEHLPDYILLDINMPLMNGWEFLDEYDRQNIDPTGKTKIFIISSSVFSNDINKAKSYPLVKDFISKPLNIDKIRELFEQEKLA